MSDSKEEMRDILIELRVDMKHVRESMDNMRQSDIKQWDKLDELNAQTTGHSKTLGFLVKGFWVVATAIASGAGGFFGWIASERK